MASSPASVSGGGPTAGLEFDLRIRSVNPGLNKMLNRVKAVYVMLGGVDEPRLDPRAVHTFDFKKSAFIAHLQRVDDMVETRDGFGIDRSSIEGIRLAQAIRTEFTELKKELEDLVATNEAEARARTGGKAMTTSEMAARRQLLAAVAGEVRLLFKRIHGYESGALHGIGGTGDVEGAERIAPFGSILAGVKQLTKDDMVKGTFGASAAVSGATVAQRETLTGDQKQKLDQIRREHVEQDAILDEIASGLDELKDIATTINDELQLQEKMLQDLDAKTDVTQDKLDAVRDRLQHTLDHMNDKSSQLCLYLICLCILAGVLTVIYNLATK